VSSTDREEIRHRHFKVSFTMKQSDPLRNITTPLFHANFNV